MKRLKQIEKLKANRVLRLIERLHFYANTPEKSDNIDQQCLWLLLVMALTLNPPRYTKEFCDILKSYRLPT